MAFTTSENRLSVQTVQIINPLMLMVFLLKLLAFSITTSCSDATFSARNIIATSNEANSSDAIQTEVLPVITSATNNSQQNPAATVSQPVTSISPHESLPPTTIPIVSKCTQLDQIYTTSRKAYESIEALECASQGFRSEALNADYFPFQILRPLPSEYQTTRSVKVSGMCKSGGDVTANLMNVGNSQIKTQVCKSGMFEFSFEIPETYTNYLSMPALLYVQQFGRVEKRFFVLSHEDRSTIKVANAAEFRSAIDSKPTAKIDITEDIDFGGSRVSFPYYFMGIVNGQGHKLMNAVVEKPFVIFAGVAQNLTLENWKWRPQTGPNAYNTPTLFGRECNGAEFKKVEILGANIDQDSEDNRLDYSAILCQDAFDSAFIDVKVSNSKVVGGTYTGGLVANAVFRVLFKNIAMSSMTILSKSAFAGALAGGLKDSVVKGIEIQGVVAGGSHVGLVAGAVTAKLRYKKNPTHYAEDQDNSLSMKIPKSRDPKSMGTQIFNVKANGNVYVGRLFGGGVFGSINLSNVDNIVSKVNVAPYTRGYFKVTPVDFEACGRNIGGFSSMVSRVFLNNVSIEGSVHGSELVGGFAAYIGNSHMKLLDIRYSGPGSAVLCPNQSWGAFASEVAPVGNDMASGWEWDTVPGGTTIEKAKALGTPKIARQTNSPTLGDNIQPIE